MYSYLVRSSHPARNKVPTIAKIRIILFFIPLLYYQLKTVPVPPQEGVPTLGVGILNFNKRMINLN